jgi:hypothetical protein
VLIGEDWSLSRLEYQVTYPSQTWAAIVLSILFILCRQNVHTARESYSEETYFVPLGNKVLKHSESSEICNLGKLFRIAVYT